MHYRTDPFSIEGRIRESSVVFGYCCNAHASSNFNVFLINEKKSTIALISIHVLYNQINDGDYGLVYHRHSILCKNGRRMWLWRDFDDDDDDTWYNGNEIQ